MEWKTVKLGDILNFRRGHDLPHSEMKDGDVPVAGSNGCIGYHNVATPVAPIITIGRSGNVGMPFYYERAWAHNTTLYIDDFKGNNPKYLYYLVKTLPLASFGGGSAVPTLNRNHIHPLEVLHISDRKAQDKIVAILSSLDAKIKNKSRINANLEAQVQALFKSWFIDFEPFGGVMPDDWKEGKLGEICVSLKEKVGDRDDVKVLSPINSGQLVLSEEFFTKQVYSASIAKYIIVPPMAFAYNPARVNIGSLGMNEFDYDGCVSPVYSVFECKDGYEYFFDLFRRTETFKEEVRSRAIGGVRQTLNYKDFALIDSVIPSKKDVERFNELYGSLLDVIKANQRENKRLAQLRDTLLPKLMKGEAIV